MANKHDEDLTQALRGACFASRSRVGSTRKPDAATVNPSRP